MYRRVSCHQSVYLLWCRLRGALKLADASFSQWEISVIWGLGVAMAIYLTAAISGTHLNPAPVVTIALWRFAYFDGCKVLPYILTQIAGAFCAAALIYGLYYNLFFDFEVAHHMVRGRDESLALAGIFSIYYPNPHLSVGQAFLVETVITAILMCLILALTDGG